LLTDVFLAARSIARQRRRSAFALAAIAFGVAALIVANGFVDWIMFKHRETTITSQFGHIQVTRKGYSEDGMADPFRYLLAKASPVQDSIERLPEVRVLGRRLAFSGLVSRGDETVSFVAEGVEPDKEEVLSSSLRVPKGANLSLDDPKGIILGLGLAANLGVDVGDSVVLMANTRDRQRECGRVSGEGSFCDDVESLRRRRPEGAAVGRPEAVESGWRPRLGSAARRNRSDGSHVADTA
jgi:putative ABC transport system permease protein